MKDRVIHLNKPSNNSQDNAGPQSKGAPPSGRPSALGPSNENPKPDEKQHTTEPAKKPIWLEMAIFGVALAAFCATALQAYIANDTEKRQLRAYVGLIPGELESFGDADKQKFSLIRKNHGATPAYDVFLPFVGQGIISIGAGIPTASTNPSVDKFDRSTIFPMGELPYIFNGSPHFDQIRTLSAQTPPLNSTQSAQIQLLRAQGEAVKEGKMQYVYWGVVTYRDVFGYGHFTRFCWMFKGANMASKDAEACLGQNDSD
jgi:hypothetical protein